MWERSTHAKKLNATLNETCHMITGCLKPTNTNSLPILAEIAPSDIRRAVASRTERTRQTTDEKHPLKWISRSCATPEIAEEFHQMHRAHQHDGESCSHGVMERTPRAPGSTNIFQLAQSTPGQHGRHSTGCVRPVKSEYSNETETCDCGIRHTMKHLPVCPMMNTACSPQDPTTANGIAIGCPRHWEDTI